MPGRINLNLGCSDQQMDGFIGVDKWTPPWATAENFLCADLEADWPWEDGSVSYIRAYDVIEHLRDKIHTMNEIWRVLSEDGTVEIIVPTTEGPGAYQDPTHVSYWNRNSFLYHTVDDPHYERFHEAYKIKGAFTVIEQEEASDEWGVKKLRIILKKSKGGDPKSKAVAIDEYKPKDTTYYRDVLVDPVVFTIIHATARPMEWMKVFNAWTAKAVWPEKLQYILVLDPKYFTIEDVAEVRVKADGFAGVVDVVLGDGGDSANYVSNVNQGAKLATGHILIVNADDQYPCDDWDRAIGSLPISGVSKHWPPGDYVISVSTGTPLEHERELMVMPVLTLQRYRRIGYVFYPRYESMYADNDFYAVAKRDGCIVDGRKLTFPHRHPLVETPGKWSRIDAAYIRQNRPEAYELGELIWKARQLANFAEVDEEDIQAVRQSLGAKTTTVAVVPKTKILISLCHATARTPDGWRDSAAAWKFTADNPNRIEHILAVNSPFDLPHGYFDHTKMVVLNGDKKDCVAAWNLAARESTGQILIMIADDFYPPKGWDTEIVSRLDVSKQQVLEVSTGGHPDVITHPILTREYYAKYGYVYYPEYMSVFCDNDFTDTAMRDGVVVAGKDLKFRHDHPSITGKPTDKVYINQGSDHAHEVGKRVYTIRSQQAGLQVKKKIAIVAPGEHFSAAWMNAWTYLLAYIIGKYDLAVYFGYSSNVYVTRGGLAEEVLSGRPTADYVLWIDDDNLLTVDHLQLLISDLESRPDIDMVAGWTWIQADVYERPDKDSRVSVGKWHPVHETCTHFTQESMAISPTDLIDIDWTGFPVVLMRYSTLVKAGRRPFLPILSENTAHGLSGEDVAFCRRAKDRGGCRLAVDRRVKVPHLKLRNAEPYLLPSVAKAEEPVPLEVPTS